MSWSCAIAILLRFYKGAVHWRDIPEMTIRQFNGMFDEIGRILKMENGGDKASSALEGQAAQKFMTRHFGKPK